MLIKNKIKLKIKSGNIIGNTKIRLIKKNKVKIKIKQK